MLQAAELARRFESDLTLLHVHAPPPSLATDMLVTPQELGAMERLELERTLAAYKDEAQRVSGRAVATAILSGDAATEIVAFAREHACDVLVIATHGRTGLKRLVLGSVAEKVIRGAPCSVVVARRKETPAPR
jgi:nucleotide-binding universal stress UspA family protein